MKKIFILLLLASSGSLFALEQNQVACIDAITNSSRNHLTMSFEDGTKEYRIRYALLNLVAGYRLFPATIEVQTMTSHGSVGYVVLHENSNVVRFSCALEECSAIQREMTPQLMSTIVRHSANDLRIRIDRATNINVQNGLKDRATQVRNACVGLDADADAILSQF